MRRERKAASLRERALELISRVFKGWIARKKGAAAVLAAIREARRLHNKAVTIQCFGKWILHQSSLS
jgi:hypothetical protein